MELPAASLMHLGSQLLLWHGERRARVSGGSADWKSWEKEPSLLVEKALVARSSEEVSQGYFLPSLKTKK